MALSLAQMGSCLDLSGGLCVENMVVSGAALTEVGFPAFPPAALGYIASSPFGLRQDPHQLLGAVDG